jgi:hypothetical protein
VGPERGGGDGEAWLDAQTQRCGGGACDDRRHTCFALAAPHFDVQESQRLQRLEAQHFCRGSCCIPPDLPLYGIASLLIMHALSGTSSLSLAHLTTHLPHSLQVLIPAWARHLPSLAPFASDVPNASHNSKMRAGGAAGLNSIWEATTGAAGPFRSDAAGFGHPLSALHSFTRACLGLSYAVPDARKSPVSAAAHAAGLPLPQSHRSANSEPWAWLVGGPGVMYDKGIKDALFVLTGILVFTTLRAATIKHVLAPLGEHVTCPPDAPASAGSGARAVQKRKEKAARQKRATVQRFAEQGWNVIYYSASLSFGLVSARCPRWVRAALTRSRSTWRTTLPTGSTPRASGKTGQCGSSTAGRR